MANSGLIKISSIKSPKDTKKYSKISISITGDVM